MNEKRQDAFFLLGLVAIVFLGLAGLSVWFISGATVGSSEQAANVRSQDSSDPPLARHSATDDLSAVERPERGDETETAQQTVSDHFAQYDRVLDGYVGTAKCAACHPNRHQSYLLTHHSRSLREVNIEEGLGQTLVHAASKQSFEVVTRDERPWHRQWRQFSNAPGDRMLLNELPVAYVMGSGAFGKGYLLADGDYLLQSPVTWYAGSDDLGMAPGYDRVHHVGMTRVIQAECMFCHAGLLTQRDGNPNHLAIHEMSIGCERCHGPGEAHAKLYQELQSAELEASDIDPKIVHPGKLDRRRSESICGQCHLHGDIVVHPPGREIWDFVAGEDLAETRLHYKHDKPGDFKDSFTGHFDQMWQSKCYLHSETLTCLTCHDPHQVEPAVDRVALRSQQCNRCHGEDEHCGLPLDQRIKQAENRCTECHMPSIESDVPHTSTTSHLIAVYDGNKPRGFASTASESLRRIQISPALPDRIVARADAIADASWALSIAREGDFDALAPTELGKNLNRILRDNPDDQHVHSLLADLNRMRADRLGAERSSVGAERSSATRENSDQWWDDVKRHATKSLQLEEQPNNVRALSLAALSSQQMRDGDFASAADRLMELTRIRRNAVDWYNLGLCFGKLHRLADAERAFREAIRLDGTYVSPYRSLSRLYRSINPSASQQMDAIAQRLMLQ